MEVTTETEKKNIHLENWKTMSRALYYLTTDAIYVNFTITLSRGHHNKWIWKNTNINSFFLKRNDA